MAHFKLNSLTFVTYCWTSIAHGDTVLLAPVAPGASPYVVEGMIDDYTGSQITIARPGGTPRAYPADRVLKVEADWNEKHASARAAMAERDYPTAIGLLTGTDREEKRVWVRRMIVAELVECHAARGELERAGDLFIALVRSDPATPAYRYAPLAWYPTTGVQPLKARAWLERRDVPAAVLLGASYLLTSTGDSQSAAQALQALAKNVDPQIAELAEAQLWRLDLQRVTAEGVERWQERLKGFPEPIQAGPTFVIGEALARIGEHDRAALAYLRVPVLHQENRHLAARAIVSAAQAMSRGGQIEEAKQLLGEVNREFFDTPQRVEAQGLLKSIGQ
jgi:tetratricopeptide (TPR) repeat protein